MLYFWYLKDVKSLSGIGNKIKGFIIKNLRMYSFYLMTFSSFKQFWTASIWLFFSFPKTEWKFEKKPQTLK